MELYWYARSASGMPLLQFLAYYQILEFYFDKYSQAEIRRRLHSIIRDPQFNPHDERDITRVLAASEGAGGRGRFRDERSQLKATVRACADADLLRSFAFRKRNKEFFERGSEGLTQKIIKESMADNDLLDGIADRIYDIRCKIVHTKDSGGGGDEVALLLPFSHEAEQLGHDTEMLRMIGRSALVTASRPLQRPPSRKV